MLVVSLLIVIPIWIFDPWHFPSAMPHRHIINAIGLLSLGVIALIAFGTAWYSRRTALNEWQHYIALVILAVFASSLFGSVNFFTYLADGRNFIIDRELNEQLKSRNAEIVIGATNALNAEKRKLTLCVQAIDSLILSPAGFVRFAFVGERPFERGIISSYRMQLPYGETLNAGEVFGTTEAGTPMQIWSLDLDRDSERISLLVSGTTTMFLKPERVDKRELIRLLFDESQRHREQISYLESVRSRVLSSFHIPVTIFLYQQAMDTIAESPLYFRPVQVLPISIELVYSLIKFIFFGTLISLLARRWAKARKTDL